MPTPPARQTGPDRKAERDVYAFLERLEAKAAASMAFPAFGGAQYGASGATGFWGDGSGVGSWMGPYLPGAQFDYAAEAGDVWLNSAVAVCVGWIADNFSEPEMRVERRRADGETKVLTEHPALDFFASPNPDYDADALWAATILSFLVSGNAYWIKCKPDAGYKLWAYYAPHWEVLPVWSRGAANQLGTPSFIDSYVHVVDGKKYPLKKEDVVHFRHGLDPRNVRSGLPQLEPVLREICADNSANSYTAGILRNWGMPSVVITPEADDVTWDEDEMRSVKRKWKQTTSGDNIGEPLVNSVALRIREMAATPDKMNINALRAVPEARICAALKIPPTVVGLSVGEGQRSYANNATDERKAYRNCLIPLQKSFARTLTRQLLPDLGGRDTESIRWDYSKVEAMSADRQQMVDEAAKLYTSGVISQEESRAKVGYGPTKPGETFMAPKGATLGVSGDVPIGESMGPQALAGPVADVPGHQPPPAKLAGPVADAPARKAADAPELKATHDHGTLADTASHGPNAIAAPDGFDGAIAGELLQAALSRLGLTAAYREGSISDAARRELLAEVSDLAADRLKQMAREFLRSLGDGTKSDDGLEVKGPLADAVKGKFETWAKGFRRAIGGTLLAGALALLGPKALDAADIARLEAARAKQEAYFDGFVAAVESGDQKLDGTFASRSAMYGMAAHSVAENILRDKTVAAGTITQERRVLGGSDHCEQCPELAAMGWQEPGTLPAIGETPCFVRCRCTFEYQ